MAGGVLPKVATCKLTGSEMARSEAAGARLGVLAGGDIDGAGRGTAFVSDSAMIGCKSATGAAGSGWGPVGWNIEPGAGSGAGPPLDSGRLAIN